MGIVSFQVSLSSLGLTRHFGPLSSGGVLSAGTSKLISDLSDSSGPITPRFRIFCKKNPTFFHKKMLWSENRFQSGPIVIKIDDS